MKIQTRPVSVTLANGLNSNIDGADQSLIRVEGPTATFTIDGIAHGRDGELLILYNPTSQTMHVTDKISSVSADGNKINLLGNSYVTVGPGTIGLIYDGDNAEWIFLFATT